MNRRRFLKSIIGAVSVTAAFLGFKSPSRMPVALQEPVYLGGNGIDTAAKFCVRVIDANTVEIIEVVKIPKYGEAGWSPYQVLRLVEEDPDACT